MKIDYSVIVPAFNEAKLIGATLGSITNAMKSIAMAGEIIVVDNDSTDDTAKIAADMGARVVFEPFRQIARARNKGAFAARGKFLIFIDADTEISADLLRAALNSLSSGKVVGGGARVEFDHPPEFFAALLLKLWQTISRSARLAAGCFLFCRADAFKQIGGFDTRLFASEEIRLSYQLRLWGIRRGLKFKILNDVAVTTSARKNKNIVQLIVTMLIFSLFPFAVRVRALCFLWYGCRRN